MPNDAKKRCESKFCNEYTVRVKRLMRNIQQKMMEKAKNMDETKKKKMIKILDKEIDKKEKQIKEECKLAYCNPTCKNTIFENGNSNKLPNGYEEMLKKKMKGAKGNKLIETMKLIRKSMFKENKSIVKNGFYKKLKSNNVKKLKKNGALSGCSVLVLSK